MIQPPLLYRIRRSGAPDTTTIHFLSRLLFREDAWLYESVKVGGNSAPKRGLSAELIFAHQYG